MPSAFTPKAYKSFHFCRIKINSKSLFFIIAVVSYVNGFIFPIEFSEPTHTVILKLPFVNPFVIPSIYSQAIHASLIKGSLIFSSIWKVVYSYPMFFSILEFSNIKIVILTDLYSITIFNISINLTLVTASSMTDNYSVSKRIPLNKLTIKDLLGSRPQNPHSVEIFGTRVPISSIYLFCFLKKFIHNKNYTVFFFDDFHYRSTPTIIAFNNSSSCFLSLNWNIIRIKFCWKFSLDKIRKIILQWECMSVA
mmetsp:Transcript_2754/g.2822  ORF Transcript_2754/g.2822 Transcript_2754/m.2822 type:complete len:251 (-) Transcript_2754:493-1245(-)